MFRIIITKTQRALQKSFIGSIKAYRWLISPLLGHTCRFMPSCSEYAMEAVAVYGTVRGSWLAIKRISRCHPFKAGGYDPVPDKQQH